MPSIVSLYAHDFLYLSLFLHLIHVMFIVHCLSIAQRVVDLVPCCADSSGDYYDEQTGEEILPTEEEREWRVDDVE